MKYTCCIVRPGCLVPCKRVSPLFYTAQCLRSLVAVLRLAFRSGTAWAATTGRLYIYPFRLTFIYLFIETHRFFPDDPDRHGIDRLLTFHSRLGLSKSKHKNKFFSIRLWTNYTTQIRAEFVKVRFEEISSGFW